MSITVSETALINLNVFSNLYSLSDNGRRVSPILKPGEYQLMSTFKFIKAVSGTVFDMINAVYHDKPLIFIKGISHTVLDMINAVYHDKPLIFIRAMFREKLVFHHRTVNEA